MVQKIKQYYFNGKIGETDLENMMGTINRNRNNSLLKCLQEKLHSSSDVQHILPVLGAGICVSAGIPNWSQLLDNIWYKLIKNDLTDKINSNPDEFPFYQSVYECLKTASNEKLPTPHGDDLLQYAEYLKHSITLGSTTNPDKLFIREVREGLNPSNKNYDPSFFPNQKNQILGRIGSMIEQFKLNVITYNFDDFLEAYLKTQGVIFKSIPSSDAMYELWDTSTIKIYHVHGCIPLTTFSGAVESETIVFAESEYMRAEHYNYEWLNAVQAERFHRKDMVIIGFSAQDYNFKRILHNLTPVSTDINEKDFDTKKHMHFIFLPVEDFLSEMQVPDDIYPPPVDAAGNVDKSDPNFNKWRNYITFVVRLCMSNKTNYFSQYGIYPIWTSHEALPIMINKILNKQY